MSLDDGTKKTLASIPLLKTKAGPREADLWVQRLKEEYTALIKFVENNKASDIDWFRLESNKDGTRWFGKCWHYHEMLRYEFDVEFDIPITYPTTGEFVENNKASDIDWFRLESNKDGTRWFGKCWHYHEMLRHEFDVEFDIPITYPTAAPEIALPELDGKTAKMYRGGKICLSDHFKPLWARNVPKFGLAHAFALGLGPWMAVEIPDLVEKGLIKPKEADEEPSSS